jgi:hypothetical protein
MARRRTAEVDNDLRAELVARAERSAQCWDFLGAGDVSGRRARAERLRNGEAEPFAGWEMANLVPGVSVHGHYRLEADDSLTLLQRPSHRVLYRARGARGQGPR